MKQSPQNHAGTNRVKLCVILFIRLIWNYGRCTPGYSLELIAHFVAYSAHELVVYNQPLTPLYIMHLAAYFGCTLAGLYHCIFWPGLLFSLVI